VGEEYPGAQSPGGFAMPPSSRITRSREIRKLLRSGKRRKTSHLDVFFLSSEESGPRVGLVVPKYRRSAVDRNLVKRRLRELSRRELVPRLRASSVSLDLLIRARREAYDVRYGQLRLELLKVTEELCSGQSSWG
jgi:ribonuclease P protein component